MRNTAGTLCASNVFHMENLFDPVLALRIYRTSRVAQKFAFEIKPKYLYKPFNLPKKKKICSITPVNLSNRPFIRIFGRNIFYSDGFYSERYCVNFGLI